MPPLYSEKLRSRKIGMTPLHTRTLCRGLLCGQKKGNVTKLAPKALSVVSISVPVALLYVVDKKPAAVMDIVPALPEPK